MNAQHSSYLDALRLDRGQRVPLHRQIYERMRSAIEQRMLQPGDRVASARALASELGVARSTVEAAYQQLTGEGYLVARGQAGTVVSVHLPPPVSRAAEPRTVDRRSRKNASTLAGTPPHGTAPPPFQLGTPALDAFPRKLWTRLAARRLRMTSAADMFYGDPCGYAPLRQAIATYLLVSRGIACRPEQVFVTAGYRASLAFVARTLLKPGDRVWTEDPGYPPTRDVLERGGHRPVAVPVDHEGMLVEHGIRHAPKARMAVVTPSHQAPLGVSLTLPRRLQLLDWASRTNAWVVEDDYDGEYRYSGAPLPALKSLDAHDRVIYAGSFSKTLYPGLALGYLVVPEWLVDTCSEAARTWSNGCPQITQTAVADFMSAGHFSRHLKKMRLLYARRRAMLVAGLAAAFGEKVRVDLTSGGMHLIARLTSRTGDRELARRAQQAGLNAQPLSGRYAARHNHSDKGLLLGFTNIASTDEAMRLCTRLRDALKG